MKDGFIGFYNPDEDTLKKIWVSSDTIFVLDTNVYLNIYSYFEKTKSTLFLVLEMIKERLWVPHHVALEYQNRRLDVMDRERENFTKIKNTFNKFQNQVDVEIINNLGLEKKMPELHQSIKELLGKFKVLCDEFDEGVFKEHRDLKPDVRSSDTIRKKLDSLLAGKVGKPFTQEELDEIYVDGESRYSNKIPPGFKDSIKDNESSDFTYLGVNYRAKFGDLIIWKQLIEESKKDNVKNVVFVTDDKKSDWWYKVGSKEIGPQEKLQSEFYSLTGVENFKMYDSIEFLKNAAEYLGMEVDDESFDDVKKAIKSSNPSYDSGFVSQVVDSSFDNDIRVADGHVANDEVDVDVIKHINDISWGRDNEMDSIGYYRNKEYKNSRRMSKDEIESMLGRLNQRGLDFRRSISEFEEQMRSNNVQHELDLRKSNNEFDEESRSGTNQRDFLARNSNIGINDLINSGFSQQEIMKIVRNRLNNNDYLTQSNAVNKRRPKDEE